MDTVIIANASVVISVTNSSVGIIRDDTFLDMEIDVKEPCFSCNLTDTKDTQTTVQNPLSINGGFIAMAAGLSVVIPLICVLIIQLRRAKREERERARRAADASGGESGGVDGPAADLPPSYEQLFGPNHVSPVHSRNGSLDALIEENETVHSGSDNEGGRSRNANAAARNNAHASIDSVDSGGSGTQQVPLVGGSPRSNTASSTSSASSTSTISSVATISGSQVTDVPVNPTSLSQPAEGSTARTTSSSSSSGRNANSTSNSSNANANASTSTSTQGSRSAPSTSSSTVDYPPPPYTSPRPSTSFTAPSTSLPSSSSSSQSGSAPPAPPPPPPPLAPRSPPPPFSSWAHRRNNPTNPNPNAVNNRQNSNSELSRLGQTLRRLPGMHISIEDFFASLRGLYDNNESSDGPPPSYEEALKILESAKIAKEHENRIH